MKNAFANPKKRKNIMVESGKNQPLEEGSLHDALLQRIRQLSFPAYCHLVRLLLYRSGYTNVQIVEPDTCEQTASPQAASHQPPGQLTPDTTPPKTNVHRLLYSGLLAVSHTDLASALTLVRVKQAKGAPVSRRFVDQLRGAMLRLGAEQGLLITTGCFSRYALASATQAPLPPVRLTDGDSLCSMLMGRSLGVRKVSNGKKGDRQRTFMHLDEPFFQLLEKRARRQKQFRQHKENQGQSEDQPNVA
jgi:hypothetical protein